MVDWIKLKVGGEHGQNLGNRVVRPVAGESPATVVVHDGSIE